MKKNMKYLINLFASILLCLIIQNQKVSAQITLDKIVSPQIGIGDDFFTARLSATETKYVFCDTLSNTFSLYNMDFTVFLSGIVVPEPFRQRNGNNVTFMRPIYITRSLFDCDSSNIEYAYEAATNSTKSFYIMRTDGTQLFKLDSANGPYCFGDCLGGTDWVKPIINTSSGAKLFLQRPYSFFGNNNIYVYSLCGMLPEDVFELNFMSRQYVKVFPNPSSDLLTFEINPPDNMNEYELVIVDAHAREVQRQKVNLQSKTYSLDTRNFNSGIYYYFLNTKNKLYQSGKFILTH